MGATKIWIIVLAVIAAVSGVAAGVLAINLSRVKGDVTTAENRAEQAEADLEDVSDEFDDVSAELDDTEAKLAKARKALNEALAEPEPVVDLATALANGTADPDPDLSAYSPPKQFTCENNSCSALSQEYVFKNDSQNGSAVTCVFGVEYDNGGTTTFLWASEFVPPGGGTDTVRVYFYGDRPIEWLSDPDDCYRGFAP